ncbi:CHASE2 domain-containing protein [Paralcaligenes ureilyticus]|uniref:histidine kinase n=1 Tax=Paralcaligenes ureilyticus TaxID=627131 RepID=A0A4R3LN37_9BURK|nr:CHASE2 domain-containing protein [Paralcaligenes ureilyticus]TCT01742.1 CHASE2 domain-containing sensor protein [Paralcaligenes ureilyticus]
MARHADFWWHLEQRIRVEWWAVVASLALFTLLISYFSTGLGLIRLDQTFYDATLATSTTRAASPDIAIIAIDDSSLEALGHWPWRRTVHARLLDRLHEAKAIGLDIVFGDADRVFPNDDAQLAQALSRQGRVVLPLVLGAGTGQRPLAPLAEAANRLGYINADLDSDGTVRSVTLQRAPASGAQAQHFVVSMLEAAAADTALARLKTRPLATPLLIPYAGPPGHFTMYPYWAVLDGRVPAARFKDKYVLIGAWGTGLGDKFSTPAARMGNAMSGVEVLANELQSALENQWISTPGRWQTALLACLPVLLACMALRRLSPRRSFLIIAAVLLLIFVASWLLMRYAQIWMPVTASLIGVALAYPVWSWRSQEAALQHIDHELRKLNSERGAIDLALVPGERTRADGSLSARITQLHGAIAQLRHAQSKREATLRFLSHDMRSPQNSILALTQMQSHPGHALPQPELLDRVNTHARKTLGLVDGFVQLARAEAIEITRQPLDLVDLVTQACDEFWALGQQHHMAILFTDHPEAAWVNGESTLLARAVCNLLDNAIKYSPDHTEISCHVYRRDQAWAILILDQGRGISLQQQTGLFEPFTRLNEDAPHNPSGAGLGLALVKTVVVRHGGSISVRSNEPRGTAFEICLPAVEM